MENIQKLLEHTRTQTEYFKLLQEAAPDRKLNLMLKKLQLREKILEELV